MSDRLSVASGSARQGRRPATNQSPVECHHGTQVISGHRDAIGHLVWQPEI